jgi:hypothetical protein
VTGAVAAACSRGRSGRSKSVYDGGEREVATYSTQGGLSFDRLTAEDVEFKDFGKETWGVVTTMRLRRIRVTRRHVLRVFVAEISDYSTNLRSILVTCYV